MAIEEMGVTEREMLLNTQAETHEEVRHAASMLEELRELLGESNSLLRNIERELETLNRNRR